MITDLFKFLLWSTLILSTALTVASPFVEHSDRVQRSAVGGGDPMRDLVFELSWKLNTYSGAPTCFVLAAGFLGILYAVEAAGRQLAAAITASPDATAQAMRRAVRPSIVPAEPVASAPKSRAIRTAVDGAAKRQSP